MKTVVNGVEITEKMAEEIASLAQDGGSIVDYINTIDSVCKLLVSIPEGGTPNDIEKFKSETWSLLYNLYNLRSTLKGFES